MTTGAEGRAESLHRVTREEMYGTVGQPTDPLKALIPTFTERTVELLVEGLKGGARRVELEMIKGGKDPQILRVKIERPGDGDLLRMVMEGNWENRPEVPAGLPVFAEFEGKFFRYRKPEDPDPITEVGAILERRGAYGLAFRGKSDIWYLRLDPNKFPHGGQITAFVQPNGTDVVKRQTLLYVDPL